MLDMIYKDILPASYAYMNAVAESASKVMAIVPNAKCSAQANLLKEISALSDKLDSEDPIEQNYSREVSSPGLDRLLVSDKDFERFRGEMIEIKLYKAIDGQKEYTGKLLDRKDGTVTIECDGKEIRLPEDSAAKINLEVIF